MAANVSAAQVHAEEKKLVDGYREALLQRKELPADAPYWSMSSTAVCLSGGGIRSAAFAMGFLQAFCEKRLLRYVDYLSAVSGGGYAAGWLTGCMCRSWEARRAATADHAVRAVASVEEQLSSTHSGHGTPPTTLREPFERRFVRAHGNYLTVRSGLLSADTWAMVYTVIRNSAYSIVGLGLLLVAMACATLLLVPLVDAGEAGWKGVIGLLGLVALMVGWIIACLKNSFDLLPNESLSYSRVGLPRWLPHVFVTAGMSLAAIYVVLEYKLRGFNDAPYAMPQQWRHWGEYLEWLVRWPLTLRGFFACLLAAVLVLGLLAMSIAETERRVLVRARRLLTEPIVLLVGLWWVFALAVLMLTRAPGVAFYAYAIWYFMAIGWAFERCVMRSSASPEQDLDLKTVMSAIFGTVLGFCGAAMADHLLEPLVRVLMPLGFYFAVAVVLMVLALAVTVMVSVVIFAQGDQSTGMHREWWARWAGECAVWSGSVAAVLLLIEATHQALAFDNWNYGPLRSRLALTAAALAFLALASVSYRGHWGRAASRVFGIGSVTSVLLLALLVGHQMAAWLAPDDPGAMAYFVTAICTLVLALLAVNISSPNTFSMHELYKHRLVRAFLGSSNPKPQTVPYVGLAIDDDIALKDLRFGAPRESLERLMCKPGSPLLYSRPYPVWGAAVNVTNNSVLGLQERKASSFIFSPMYCGFEQYTAERLTVRTAAPYAAACAYQRSEECGASQPANRGKYKIETMTAGLAMAVSGAAFTSNSGATTKPERSFVLTLLGLRLGYWLPNPAKKLAWRLGSACGWVRGHKNAVAEVFQPNRWSMSWLTREALADCGIFANGVYVSDGGHFENLGIYEMLRRRVPLIVVSDASCDPKYTFDDLLNLIAKARADFSIEIELDSLDALRPAPATRLSQAHLVEGRIVYERGADGEPSVEGRIVYCKASLTGDEDQDLLNYRKRNPSFPHLSTVNQWFAESVFEAYRALGLHIGRSAAAAYWRHIASRAGPSHAAASGAAAALIDSIKQAAESGTMPTADTK